MQSNLNYLGKTVNSINQKLSKSEKGFTSSAPFFDLPRALFEYLVTPQKYQTFRQEPNQQLSIHLRWDQYKHLVPDATGR